MATKKEKNITTFNEHLDKRYGKHGTKKRTAFEIKAKAFMAEEMAREERHIANLPIKHRNK